MARKHIPLTKGEIHVALAVVSLCDVIVNIGTERQFENAAQLLLAALYLERIRSAAHFTRILGKLPLDAKLSFNERTILRSMWTSANAALTVDEHSHVFFHELVAKIGDVGLEYYVSLTLKLKNLHDEVCGGGHRAHLNPRRSR